MNIELKRFHGTKGFTAGELFIDGVKVFDTLEDEERTEKVYAETAIPVGKYEVVINHSPRFKKDLPLLLNVPGFTGIRIHSGNLTSHTEGCILIGNDSNSKDAWLGNSRAAMERFMPMLRNALKRDKVWIEIS